jgi:hypothetical protein
VFVPVRVSLPGPALVRVGVALAVGDDAADRQVAAPNWWTIRSELVAVLLTSVPFLIS